MAEIPLKNQPFDLTFHPSAPIVYVGLLTGEIKAFSYSTDKSEDEFEYQEVFGIRPTKRSCRGLATSVSGDRLYSVTKDKTFHEIDTSNGAVLQTIVGAHESSINRVSLTMPNVVASGDDDGVIKLWDPRKKGEIRAYKHHFDYISDFMWLEDKKQLVTTSGDGSLSVIDVRANKTEPFAHSEDQEDELLSIVSIKGATRTVVGTQSGILSVFNRSAGWGDSVDRIPGHPHSVDALYNIPSHLIPDSSSSSAQAIIATGSSDGLVRLVQLYPTKVLGVVADHGDFPVERIKMDYPGGGGAEDDSKTRWLGSISHGERILLTDLKDVLEESDNEDEEEGGKDDLSDSSTNEAVAVNEGDEDSSDEDPPMPTPPSKPSVSSFGFPTPGRTSRPSSSSNSAGKSSGSALDNFSFSGTLAETSARVVENLSGRSIASVAVEVNELQSDDDEEEDLPASVPQIRKTPGSDNDSDDDASSGKQPRKKKLVSTSSVAAPAEARSSPKASVEPEEIKRKKKRRKKATKKGGAGGGSGAGSFFADL